MKTLAQSIVYLGLMYCFSGCSSAPTPPADSPPPAPAVSTPKPKPSAEPTSAGVEAATAAPEPAQTAEPSTAGDGLRKASRPPVELITNPTALYVFNFAESDVGRAATSKCEAAGGERREIAACLQKARDKVPVESLRFKKKGTEYWWITLNRYKGNLLKWHIIQFQVGEEKADRVTLKPMGKDKGIAPLAKLPRTLEIELPNDYSIVVVDPEFGKMVYDAKIGKIEED
jgi:hypothetical protein